MSTMSYYFRGTAEDMMSSLFSDLHQASKPGPASSRYFEQALASFVGLVDRQAELGHLDPKRLQEFRDEAYQALLAFGEKLQAYPKTALILAEDRGDRWYEVCVRRSAIQLLLDTYSGSALAALINPADTTALDEEMYKVGHKEGPIPEDLAPKGLPSSHWWWRYPGISSKGTEWS